MYQIARFGSVRYSFHSICGIFVVDFGRIVGENLFPHHLLVAKGSEGCFVESAACGVIGRVVATQTSCETEACDSGGVMPLERDISENNKKRKKSGILLLSIPRSFW